MRLFFRVVSVMALFGFHAAHGQNMTPCENSSIAITTLFTAPASTPTASYTVFGYRQGDEVVHQYWNAARERFYLGGAPGSYCPEEVESESACPVGNVTAFVGLVSLDAEVPGGQAVYIAVEGYLGFTQAHSASYPPGAILGSFAFFQPGYDLYGYLSTDAFGALGFMACPTRTGAYQVFAALPNATVPNGNISSCIGFDAITEFYNSTAGAAAWQYT